MELIASPESSTIEHFGYDRESQVLKVSFKSGTTYDYYDIPEQVFESLKIAPSKGQFLAQQIKGKYRYARM